MRNSHLFVTALLLALLAAQAVPAADEAFSYREYAVLLEEFVGEDGMVDYRDLRNRRGRLDRFASALGNLEESTFHSWDRKARIAFLVNAYNALTLQVIVDHYPIQASFLGSLRFPRNSIRQISGVWDEIQFEVLGRQRTLDDLEHNMLRRDYREPRIHMALVCASMSCPSLRREPFTAERLEEQLESQSRIFLSDSRKFRIDRASSTVYLSRIFDWYGGDFPQRYATNIKFKRFGETERAVLNFVSQHLIDRDRRYLEEGSYRIRYLDYDWSLNDQR